MEHDAAQCSETVVIKHGKIFITESVLKLGGQNSHTFCHSPSIHRPLLIRGGHAGSRLSRVLQTSLSQAMFSRYTWGIFRHF